MSLLMLSSIKTLAKHELTARQCDKATYTESLALEHNDDVKEFLADFKTTFKRHKATKVLDKYPTVKQFYTKYVPKKINDTAFWQRYYYRCDKGKILKGLQELTPAEIKEKVKQVEAANKASTAASTTTSLAASVRKIPELFKSSRSLSGRSLSGTLAAPEKDGGGDEDASAIAGSAAAAAATAAPPPRITSPGWFSSLSPGTNSARRKLKKKTVAMETGGLLMSPGLHLDNKNKNNSNNNNNNYDDDENDNQRKKKKSKKKQQQQQQLQQQQEQQKPLDTAVEATPAPSENALPLSPVRRRSSSKNKKKKQAMLSTSSSPKASTRKRAARLGPIDHSGMVLPKGTLPSKKHSRRNLMVGTTETDAPQKKASAATISTTTTTKGGRRNGFKRHLSLPNVTRTNSDLTLDEPPQYTADDNNHNSFSVTTKRTTAAAADGKKKKSKERSPSKQRLPPQLPLSPPLSPIIQRAKAYDEEDSEKEEGGHDTVDDDDHEEEEEDSPPMQYLPEASSPRKKPQQRGRSFVRNPESLDAYSDHTQSIQILPDIPSPLMAYQGRKSPDNIKLLDKNGEKEKGAIENGDEPEVEILSLQQLADMEYQDVSESMLDEMPLSPTESYESNDAMPTKGRKELDQVEMAEGGGKGDNEEEELPSLQPSLLSPFGSSEKVDKEHTVEKQLSPLQKNRIQNLDIDLAQTNDDDSSHLTVESFFSEDEAKGFIPIAHVSHRNEELTPLSSEQNGLKKSIHAEMEGRVLAAVEEARLLKVRLEDEAQSRVRAEEEIGMLKSQLEAEKRARVEAQKEAVRENQNSHEAKAKILAEESTLLRSRLQKEEDAKRLAEEKLLSLQSQVAAEVQARVQAQQAAKEAAKAQDEARFEVEVKNRLVKEGAARLEVQIEARLQAEHKARELERNIMKEEELRAKLEKEVESLKSTLGAQEKAKDGISQLDIKKEQKARLKAEEIARVLNEEITSLQAQVLLEKEAKLKVEEEVKVLREDVALLDSHLAAIEKERELNEEEDEPKVATEKGQEIMTAKEEKEHETRLGLGDIKLLLDSITADDLDTKPSSSTDLLIDENDDDDLGGELEALEVDQNQLHHELESATIGEVSLAVEAPGEKGTEDNFNDSVEKASVLESHEVTSPKRQEQPLMSPISGKAISITRDSRRDRVLDLMKKLERIKTAQY